MKQLKAEQILLKREQEREERSRQTEWFAHAPVKKACTIVVKKPDAVRNRRSKNMFIIENFKLMNETTKATTLFKRDKAIVEVLNRIKNYLPELKELPDTELWADLRRRFIKNYTEFERMSIRYKV
jgi:hypothetical protein